MTRMEEIIIIVLGVLFVLYLIFHEVTYICPKCGKKMTVHKKNGIKYLECPRCGHKSIDM